MCLDNWKELPLFCFKS